jgi:DNA-binding CsgD family transcriptional regulator
MPTISELPEQAVALFGQARDSGFDKFMYAVDLLDGQIDPPVEVLTHGLSEEFLSRYFNRLREDPLRRMVARGEIPVSNTPIAFENTRSFLSIARDQRLTSGDTSQLRWFLAQGMRTGISFRIRMSQGRCASLNFYSADPHSPEHLESAMQRLFLIGHKSHALLEPKLNRTRGTILSAREVECLQWISLGKTNREIASQLGLSVDTVKEHVQSLFNRLQVNSRAQAVARAHMLAYLD